MQIYCCIVRRYDTLLVLLTHFFPDTDPSVVLYYCSYRAHVTTTWPQQWTTLLVDLMSKVM